MLTEIIDGNYIGMIEAGQGERLRRKARQLFHVPREFGRENFEGDFTLKVTVKRQIDFSHPAFAQWPDDFVVVDDRFGLELVLINCWHQLSPIQELIHYRSR